ncbi:3-deoxy-7-phosphoheptulonate synthase [Larsenimonas rhizosphaerae]|uniref:3-deoxy-7-phosphoheptulonate synthase n=1 Tax=Larsenimonas rhizosphaerae TaxID=2944682 RepID=UPI0020336F51|nr:3-deoxy-7-phosphoheptulonate synthase [Larsenimonas rhizosphaerae]MCM2129686.1 3-deoxy-7-phosphoheptulonate synthase [Larsenimonas rhizosphaerae]
MNVETCTSSPACHQSLPSPAMLRQAIPSHPDLDERIKMQRRDICRVLSGEDSRLLVVTGPCSIHDPVAALDYAQRLLQLSEAVSDQLLLVMRVYIEKPRTITGWKGLAYDPQLDGSHDMAEGLRQSREVMRDIVSMGLPVATELLNPVVARYVDDLLAWGAIGARTTESQLHREMVSGLSLPVGFKNDTHGGIQVAVDAINSAAHGHYCFSVDDSGQPAACVTPGNRDTHLVLRGGASGPNFSPESVASASTLLAAAGVAPAIMVDCSHANSFKNPERQPEVLSSVIAQRRGGAEALRGVMLESFIAAGRQAFTGTELIYGQSVTDGCLSWERTEQELLRAAQALRAPMSCSSLQSVSVE